MPWLSRANRYIVHNPYHRTKTLLMPETLNEPKLPFAHWRYYVWGAWLSFWGLMILVALQDSYWRGGAPLWQPLLWEGSSAVVSTFLISMQYRSLPRWRPLLNRPMQWFLAQLWWMPLIIVLFVVGTYAIRHGVYALLGTSYEHEPWPQVFLYEGSKVFVFFSLFTVAQFAVESFRAFWVAQQRNFANERALTEARQALLKSKIQPHFLFNSLNTISAVMHQDVFRAEQLIADLATLLREGMALDQRYLVQLHEEWQFLSAYSHLMLARFAPRVSVTWSFDETLRDIDLPPLVLQPLLENFFVHGAEKIPGTYALEIMAHKEPALAIIEIRSNKGSLAATYQEGGGLTQARERLRLALGDQAQLSLLNLQPEGVLAQLKITLPTDESSEHLSERHG